MSEVIKILFVCSQNKWRSLTAEKIFAASPKCQVRSAGTSNNARIKLTAGHIGWADLIFAMEDKHIQIIKSKFGESFRTASMSDRSRVSRNLVCLQIPDVYKYMDEELIEILMARVSEHIDL